MDIDQKCNGNRLLDSKLSKLKRFDYAADWLYKASNIKRSFLWGFVWKKVKNPKYEIKSYFYHFSGIPIRESNSRLHLDDNGSKLRLTSLEMSDTANYSCHAKNLYGQDSITYTLIVKCKKRLSNSQGKSPKWHFPHD